jgi:hypothetical protein
VVGAQPQAPETREAVDVAGTSDHRSVVQNGRTASLAFLAIAVAVSGMASAPSARADVPGEELARRSFEDALSLEKKGAYADALAKFRESSAIKVTLGNRYHVAYCLEMTGKLAAALSEYEAVGEAAREQRKNDVAEATRVRMEALRPRVPTLAIRITVPSPAPIDAVVKLDDEPLAAVLLDGRAFRVEPGAHTVTARTAERTDFTRTVECAEGSASNVDISLPPQTPPRAAPVLRPEPTLRTAHTPSRVPEVLATVGAGAFLVGGIAAFVAAGRAQHDGRATCLEKVSCKSEQTQVRSLDALALSGLLGAAALGTVAVLLWTRTSAPKAAIAARGSWLGVEGRFE